MSDTYDLPEDVNDFSEPPSSIRDLLANASTLLLTVAAGYMLGWTLQVLWNRFTK